MRRFSKRAVAGIAAGTTALAMLATGVSAGPAGDTGDNAWPYNATIGAPVLAAVGDVACQPDDTATDPGEQSGPSGTCDDSGSDLRNQAMATTADQIEAMQPNLVALLGDEQYQVGTYADFQGSFNQTYGAFKFLERPSPGNHEYYNEHGELGDDGIGYFDYFNGTQLGPNTGQPVTAPDPFGNYVQPVPRPEGQAGTYDPATNNQGWYSYDLGNWHIISLNVECAAAPNFTSCTPLPAWFSAETAWLAQDLDRDHAACTLAYWHQPTFSVTGAPASSTQPGPDGVEGDAAMAWWDLLYKHGADIVLNGHEHVYARFAPMNTEGTYDPRHGIRQFIVGTGGESLDSLYTDSAGNVAVPNLQAAQGAGTSYSDGVTTQNYPGAFGVMKLALGNNGYTWAYQSATAPTTASGTPAWGSFSDAGSGRCHGPNDD